jgi:multiple sugar transport system permease protein
MTSAESTWRNFPKGMAFISPWLIGFLCFTLGPILLAVYFSFCDYPLLERPVWLGLANYRELFHDPVFGKTLLVTFKYAAMALPASMLV